jgi:hypothetical protein
MSALEQAAAILDAYRADMEADAVIVSFASRAPNTSAMIDHYSVEMVADGVRYSASAKNPLDAASLARLKIKDAREAKAKKAAKQGENA